MSVREAAERYGLSVSRLRELAQAGTIEGKKFGPVWAIESVSVEQYLRTRRPPGRPKTS